MGIFSDDKSKSSSEDTAKRLRQKKKTLKLDQQINDLQIKKANAADDRGSGEGGDNFWTDWYGKDLDW